MSIFRTPFFGIKQKLLYTFFCELITIFVGLMVNTLKLSFNTVLLMLVVLSYYKFGTDLSQDLPSPEKEI